MHSPLVIPELEFMHKWPIINVVKAAKSHPTGSPIAAPTDSSAIGNETFHILDSLKEEGNETLPLPSKKRESSQETVRHQCEMVGITSYGSRQCASDEVREILLKRYLTFVILVGSIHACVNLFGEDLCPHWHLLPTGRIKMILMEIHQILIVKFIIIKGISNKLIWMKWIHRVNIGNILLASQ